MLSRNCRIKCMRSQQFHPRRDSENKYLKIVPRCGWSVSSGLNLIKSEVYLSHYPLSWGWFACACLLSGESIISATEGTLVERQMWCWNAHQITQTLPALLRRLFWSQVRQKRTSDGRKTLMAAEAESRSTLSQANHQMKIRSSCFFPLPTIFGMKSFRDSSPLSSLEFDFEISFRSIGLAESISLHLI